MDISTVGSLELNSDSNCFEAVSKTHDNMDIPTFGSFEFNSDSNSQRVSIAVSKQYLKGIIAWIFLQSAALNTAIVSKQY